MIKLKFKKLTLWHFYKEKLEGEKERKKREKKKKREREKKRSKSLGSLPSLLECQTPGALDRRWLGITGAAAVTYPVILLASEFFRRRKLPAYWL